MKLNSFNFINLTDGIEWINEIENYSFIRIESTAIEKNDWTRILRDLDANFLIHVALGHECNIYDCGTNRPTSKTISIGISKIKELLKEIWEGKFVPKTKEAISMKRKICYYKRYYKGIINIVGYSRSTSNDGNKSYFIKMLEEKYGE